MLYQESVNSQHFFSQTGWAPHCETGPALDQSNWLFSASDLVGHILIDFTHQEIWISVITQGGGGSFWVTDWAWIIMEGLKKLLKSMLSSKVRAYIKDYCKRNGLLTLSVIAVITGCVLGFILRSLNLSTQVCVCRNGTGGNGTGFMSYRLPLYYLEKMWCDF